MPASSGSYRVRWFVLVGALWASTAPAETWRVTVEGHGTGLGETPVVAALEPALPAGDYALVPEGGGTAIPAQVLVDGGTRYLAAVLPHVAGKDPERYTLVASKGPSAGEGVSLRREGVDIAFDVDGKPFIDERAADGPKPYYFPIHGPTGALMTRGFPMRPAEGEDRDHFHQRSMWLAHGSVNGVDFWASDPLNKPNPRFGTIRETARDTALAGAAVGRLRTTDDWLGPDGKKVCEDERVLTVYHTRAARVLDLDVTLRAAAAPVTFGDTKEGTFGLRVASSMNVDRKKGGEIVNADGLTDAAAWGKRAAWVDYTGPIEGETVGIAILNHPDSFRYPTTWHVRTYGLFAANPFGWHDFGMKTSGAYTLAASESIRLRYRVIFHQGNTAAAQVARAFEGYARPPRVRVTGE